MHGRTPERRERRRFGEDSNLLLLLLLLSPRSLSLSLSLISSIFSWCQKKMRKINDISQPVRLFVCVCVSTWMPEFFQSSSFFYFLEINFPLFNHQTHIHILSLLLESLLGCRSYFPDPCFILLHLLKESLFRPSISRYSSNEKDFFFSI